MSRKRSGRSSPRKAGEVIARVRPVAAEIARAHGLALWSVSFSRVAGRDVLRVAADRVGGVSSGELALLSDDLGRELDHADAVPGLRPYVLEVTSPGAERKLHAPEHYRVCRGLLVRLWFAEGRAPLDGVIGDADDEGVDVETDAGSTRVRFDEIDRAQLRVTEIG